MKRISSIRVILVLTATLSVFVARDLPAQAVYVSNLVAGDDSGVVCDATTWDAAEFTTGGNLSGYNLDSVEIAIDGIWVVDGSGFSLSIYSNNSGLPGSSLGTLSGSSNPSVAGNYAYTASGISLSPYTSYWIVGNAATAFPNGSFLWGDTTSSAYASSGGWSMNSATRDLSSDNGSSWTSTAVSVLRFSVAATPAPEPQPFPLAGLGLAIVLLRSRKYTCVRLTAS